MKEHSSEIIVGISGIALAAASWFFGAKQATKNESKRVNNETNDILTRGADQIVDTSNKLLETVKTMLDEERQHRQTCEHQLREITKKVDELEIKLKELEK